MSKPAEPSIYLVPVCLFNGDAIFICIDYAANSKHCYLVDGGRAAGNSADDTDGSGGGGAAQLQGSNGSTITVRGVREDDYAMLEGVYDALVQAGYSLQGIIVTHPDEDHYAGITKLLTNRKPSCPVLVTTEFLREFQEKDAEKMKSVKDAIDKLKSIELALNNSHQTAIRVPKEKLQNDTIIQQACAKIIGTGRTVEKRGLVKAIQSNYDIEKFQMSLSPRQGSRCTESPVEFPSLSCFSMTSPLVLYKHEKSSEETKLAPLIETADSSEGKNRSSIITTIRNPMNDSQLPWLACLTGDAELKDREVDIGRIPKNIPVIQVPHHGSKYNSSIELYRKTKSRMHLISSGEVANPKWRFPTAEVLKAISDATKPADTSIIVTRGKWLNGEKMNGVDHSTSIYYWDSHVYEDQEVELIKEPFLQIQLHPHIQRPDQLKNIIAWNNDGYKRLAECYKEKNRSVFKESNSNRTIDVIDGLPSPTAPCNWDKSNLVAVLTTSIERDDMLITFLRKSSGDEFYMFQCQKNPIWKIKYATSESVNPLHVADEESSVQWSLEMFYCSSNGQGTRSKKIIKGCITPHPSPVIKTSQLTT